MNKKELVEAVADEVNLPRKRVEDVISKTLELIQVTTADGESVRLMGFGTFSRVHRQARSGRNPKTGEALEIPEREEPKFSAGAVFKDTVRSVKRN